MKTILTFIALLCTVGFTSAAEALRPNIVVFIADDLGWADVPWHGSMYKMPNLARLADQSLRLESHYVHPMCSPTRAAFMTGRYASRFGVTGAQNPRCLPWNTVTLASALKSAGYETAITGKWHLGSKPEEGPQKFGFDHGYGSLAGGCGPLNHRYKEGEFTYTWHRNGKLIEEEGHVTDLIAREAVQWLEGRGDKPFFLYVPFTAIHVPMLEPEKWHQMNAHLTDPAQQLRAACASHMDDAIGQVLAVLDRKKLRENTLVLFFGDNGAHAPQDNQGGPYPGDYGHLRVGNTNAPLRAVDWMPTLCGLAGAKIDKDLKWDGMDIWPMLNNPMKPVAARTIYTAAPGFRAQALRHGDWKLIVTRADGKKGQAGGEELFDLASDLGETKNLATERSDLLAEMKKRLADISSRDRDAVAND
jgi:arylsulfatase A-like enzyme